MAKGYHGDSLLEYRMEEREGVRNRSRILESGAGWVLFFCADRAAPSSMFFAARIRHLVIDDGIAHGIRHNSMRSIFVQTRLRLAAKIRSLRGGKTCSRTSASMRGKIATLDEAEGLPDIRDVGGHAMRVSHSAPVRESLGIETKEDVISEMPASGTSAQRHESPAALGSVRRHRHSHEHAGTAPPRGAGRPLCPFMRECRPGPRSSAG